MNSSDLAAVLAPIVTALLGTAGVLTQDWRRRRSSAYQRARAYDDAIRQVTFAEQWWKARQAMDPDASQTTTGAALSWIDQARDHITSLPPATPASESKPLIRRLLLLYPFSQVSAKLLRVVFYLLLAFMTLTALVAAGNVLSGEGANFSRDSIAWQFIGSVLFGLIILIIGAGAAAIEKAARQPPAPV